MKKLIAAIILSVSVTSHAGLFDFFDLSKFVEGALTIAEGINENLEKIRLEQQKVLDVREQWEQTCETAQLLNPSLVALNKLLVEHNVNKEFCAPITTALRLQSDVLTRCQDFYNKPVPENAEYLNSKVTLSVMQAKLVLTKCFPIIGQIKFPGMPGSGN